MAKRRKTKDRIWDLYYEGYPTRIIAEKLKITEWYVVRVLGLE